MIGNVKDYLDFIIGLTKSHVWIPAPAPKSDPDSWSLKPPFAIAVREPTLIIADFHSKRSFDLLSVLASVATWSCRRSRGRADKT